MQVRLSVIALLLLVLGAGDLRATGRACAEAPEPPAPTREEAVIAPDPVLTSLNRALAWYRQARIVMRSMDDVGVFARADEQTALRLLASAFDAARAQASLIGAPDAKARRQGAPARAQRAEVLAEVRKQEQEVARLRARLRGAPAGRRSAIERDLVAARNRLELERARLDFLERLQGLQAVPSGADDDLEQQIDAIQEAVPELRAAGAATPATPATPAAAAEVSPAWGTWGLTQRLLALHRSRRSIDELMVTTSELASGIDDDFQALRAAMRPVGARLRELAADPAAGGVSLADSQREFRELLERNKRLAAVLLPLREQAALARRFGADLHGWRAAVDRESRQVLQSLGLDLLGVIATLGVVLLGGSLWRVAVTRYVPDGPRRRLLLTLRTIVIAAALVLVLVFHFTSEIGALVTVLGFTAAGIAFALQNVILAIAGYFTMAAPNGIRVGDRVSLQGPFGYVHGEVLEIGFVRIRLQELAGEGMRPTGRVVVFPNSVVFTGSFFKHPAAAAA